MGPDWWERWSRHWHDERSGWEKIESWYIGCALSVLIVMLILVLVGVLPALVILG